MITEMSFESKFEKMCLMMLKQFENEGGHWWGCYEFNDIGAEDWMFS